jgi:hypothetical protein
LYTVPVDLRVHHVTGRRRGIDHEISLCPYGGRRLLLLHGHPD